MNSQKEYETKIRRLNQEIKRLNKKILKSQSLCKTLRTENKYLRKRLKALIASRDKWKAKLKDKQQEIKLLRNQINRRGKAKWHHYETWIVVLGIFLRTKCNCSYGSIVKILTLLNVYFHLNLIKIPCANTVQNWVSKVGLYQLKKQPKQLLGKEISIIIDESIRLGQEKLLLVLACPFAKRGEEALSFIDVKVVFMEGSKSWKGIEIATVIQEQLIDQGLNVMNVISDEGSNLINAVALLKLDHLPDIGHALATCLRQTFEKDSDYKAFIQLTASFLSKGVNQDLSYLIPPKLGKKARFMNQSRVIHWAKLLLANWEELNKKEKDFFAKLLEHSKMIQILDTCMAIAKIIALVLKNEGLSNKTLKDINQKLEAFNHKAGLVSIFLTKIKEYLSGYKQFLSKYPTDYCIHVSTDIIESIFGKYKNKANNYALTGLTRLNLELPLYCIEEKEIEQVTHLALEDISMTHLSEWVMEHSHDNQLIRRLKFRENRA